MSKVIEFNRSVTEIDDGRYDNIENYINARIKEEGYEPVDFDTLQFIVGMFINDMKIYYDDN